MLLAKHPIIPEEHAHFICNEDEVEEGRHGERPSLMLFDHVISVNHELPARLFADLLIRAGHHLGNSLEVRLRASKEEERRQRG